ncbi:MAG: HAD family hydrolase [bacterium]|nr:HAD family hydrolase [bacterium]
MPVDLILFDLDGTLVNTLDDIAASMNRALAARGLSGHPLRAYCTFVGDGVGELAKRALPADAVELAPTLVTEFLTDYNLHMLDQAAPYEGVESLLDALEDLEVAQAIVSNKPHAATVLMTERLFPLRPWRAVLGQREHCPPKPDPTSTLEVAGALGVNPAACLFVGDSDIDIETGRRAGMGTVGVDWGYRGRAELEAAGAEFVIDSPGELVDIVEIVRSR